MTAASSTAAFPAERLIGLADYVQVKSAELRDGMLSIELVREIPEEMKPRRIEIGGEKAQRLERETGEQDRSSKTRELEAA